MVIYLPITTAYYYEALVTETVGAQMKDGVNLFAVGLKIAANIPVCLNT
jgi:hypothetical protein